jgi:hypothetical protein
MRRDATIDRQQVLVPNASTLGCGKYKAQFGDVVLYKELNGHTRIARVAGRIKFAPALEPQEKSIRNWLLVIALDERLSWSFERWVNPADVIECFDPENEHCRMQELLAFIFSPKFKQESIETLRRYAGEWTTPDRLREWEAKRDAEHKDYESRKAAQS